MWTKPWKNRAKIEKPKQTKHRQNWMEIARKSSRAFVMSLNTIRNWNSKVEIFYDDLKNKNIYIVRDSDRQSDLDHAPTRFDPKVVDAGRGQNCCLSSVNTNIISSIHHIKTNLGYWLNSTKLRNLSFLTSSCSHYVRNVVHFSLYIWIWLSIKHTFCYLEYTLFCHNIFLGGQFFGSIWIICHIVFNGFIIRISFRILWAWWNGDQSIWYVQWQT